MTATGFDDIARRYEQDSLLQQVASEVLFGLLGIGGHDDVLDLGCGTGRLTGRIRGMTEGQILGIDPSAGMIAEASANYGGPRTRFAVLAAEDLLADAEFDVIFSNSAFQWFADAPRALRACHRALRPGGRMAIQAPATSAYCPNFLAAIERVAADERTGSVCSRFRSPWLFLEEAGDYQALFEAAGFEVRLARIDVARTRHSPEEVMRMFESGAAAGYLDQRNYGVPFPREYPATAREIIRSAFEAQSDAAGQVNVVFNRIYLLANVRRNHAR